MNGLYPIIRRQRRPLLPVEESSPSPQPSPPGEGARQSAPGNGTPLAMSGAPETAPTLDVIPPLPGGEGRGEGERAPHVASFTPLVSVAEALEKARTPEGSGETPKPARETRALPLHRRGEGPA